MRRDFVEVASTQVADPEDIFVLVGCGSGKAGPSPADVGGNGVFVPDIFEAFSAGGGFGLDPFIAVGAAQNQCGWKLVGIEMGKMGCVKGEGLGFGLIGAPGESLPGENRVKPVDFSGCANVQMGGVGCSLIQFASAAADGWFDEDRVVTECGGCSGEADAQCFVAGQDAQGGVERGVVPAGVRESQDACDDCGGGGSDALAVEFDGLEESRWA